MQIRPATADDFDAVMQVLDAAGLETDRERTRDSIAAGGTVVAVEGGRLLGAAVAVSEASATRIEAIAVRKRRQAQGIGTALVESLVPRHGRLVADFDAGVRPFYESLDFEITPLEAGGRFQGRYPPERA